MPKKKKNRGKKTNKVKPEVRQKMSTLETPIEPTNLDLFNAIIKQRSGETFTVDPDVAKVRAFSVREESSGQKTKKREFYYSDGKFVKEGLDYHIYYTSNLEQYYMTGEVSIFSFVISIILEFTSVIFFAKYLVIIPFL